MACSPCHLAGKTLHPWSPWGQGGRLEPLQVEDQGGRFVPPGKPGVLVPVTLTVMKRHEQKQTGKKRGYLAYIFTS